MATKIWIALISSITFGLGIAIASYAITSGPGGQAKLKLGQFSFEIAINEADLPALLAEKSGDNAIKQEVKRIFDLYELDTDLATKISTLNYQQPFSENLRKMRDRFVGPFNAPDVSVEVKFSDTIKANHAKVCPDSVFYRERINIALSDFSNMYPVDDAGIAIIHGCPTPNGMPQPITISTELGKKLLQQEDLPPSITAVAKVLPSYVVVK